MGCGPYPGTNREAIDLTYLQTIVIGFIQGVAELFPISSLGHTVLVPALIGGSWARLVTDEASPESPYLAFVVGLHVATALAMFWLLRAEWVRLLRAFLRSLASRRMEGPEARLAWLVVVATIPVGLIGLILEHKLRVLFAKPLAAAIFLTVNGCILLTGELLRRHQQARPKGAHRAGRVTEASELRLRDAGAIGVAECAALLAGISRDGICIVAGLLRGLDREQAGRFAILLSAPPILAAGLLKVPDLLGPLGNGIRPQVLAGSAVAFVTAFFAAKLLLRWLRSGTLWPFAVYSLLFGAACIINFS